jgi:hypothetical protein
VIAGVAGTDDPVPSDGVEPEHEHGFGGLGGETSPVVIRVEDESDLSLPALPADQLQPDLPDHLPGLAPHYGEREPVALGAEAGLTALTDQGVPHLRVVTGIPVEIPGHIRAGLVSVQIVEVVGRKRTQDQPGCFDGAVRAEHWPMVAGQ